MYDIMLNIMLILSVFSIIVIAMQSTKLKAHLMLLWVVVNYLLLKRLEDLKPFIKGYCRMFNSIFCFWRYTYKCKKLAKLLSLSERLKEMGVRLRILHLFQPSDRFFIE